MRRHIAPFFIAFCVLSTLASGQNASEAPATKAATCRAADEMGQVDLLGLWKAEVESEAGPIAVLLEKSREFSEGVAGGIDRDGRKAQIAGDIEDGELKLEESEDGTHITATWTGRFSEGSCGKEIRGTWQSAQPGLPRRFVLRKQGAL